jgi:hypothetical protein
VRLCCREGKAPPIDKPTSKILRLHNPLRSFPNHYAANVHIFPENKEYIPQISALCHTVASVIGDSEPVRNVAHASFWTCPTRSLQILDLHHAVLSVIERNEFGTACELLSIASPLCCPPINAPHFLYLQMLVLVIVSNNGFRRRQLALEPCAKLVTLLFCS